MLHLILTPTSSFSAQTIHVAHGDARQTLVRIAAYHKVDLVIAGKRTKKGLAGLSGGSTTNYLVHHAPAPVLVIK